jgi:selenide,water dikinase
LISSDVKLKDLVLVGGGHSHVEVLRQLAMQPVSGLRVTLVSREMQTPYSGMLPGFIAGYYTWDDIHIDLAPLCSSAGVRLIVGVVDELLPEERILHCAGRPPIRYDLLSINAGSSPSVGGIKGADQIGIPVKPLDQFLPRWQALLQGLRSSVEKKYSIVVVGGGAGGVELALSMRHRFTKVECIPNVDISLATADCGLLLDHNEGARTRLSKKLGKAEIKVHLNMRIAAAEKGRLLSDAGDEISADEVLWVTQAAPKAWPSAAGLAADDGGFIRINDRLQSVSHPNVFAAGDIAGMEGRPRPKSGVFAVRQGPVLAENLRRAACSRPLKRYSPQKHFLSLISTGERYAVASRGGFAAQGAWLWYVKNWIDRRFMKKFDVDPSQMQPAAARWHVRDPQPVAADEDEMRCGGCGAKVGGDLLSRVLSRLRVSTPSEVVTGIGDDAALLRPVANTLEVQTIDGFRAMLDDPYLLGRIATEHSINDVYAMGGAPRTALVWGQVPFGGDQQMEDDLFQMMSGIVEVLDEAGATLVGGHSGEAAELGVGVAISGSVHEREAWRNNRVALGDLLVLTKPIGTGILLAANMRAQCQGAWLANAIDAMRQSNRNALDVFRKFYVKACTDVSGFGLLAHAGQLARSANLSLEIWPETIPLLPGVADTVHEGIVSTLQASNEKILSAVEIGEFKRSDLRVRVLLDPQTSGGLLAAVKADRAESCLADLKAAGFIAAAVIGRVRAARDDEKWAVLQKI